MTRKVHPGVLIGVLGFSSWAMAALLQAIVPAAAPTANKQGNGDKFQITTGVALSGDCALYDANLNLVKCGSSFMTYAGVMLPHGKLVEANSLNTAGTGDIDLYTVPANKRAYVLGYLLYNGNAASNVNFGEAKIGGTYYRLNSNITTLTTTINNSTSAIVLEAGEIFAVSSDHNAANIWASIVEYDSTAGLYSPRLTTFAAGANTIYTVPASKTAVVLSTQTNFSTVGAGNYTNASGNARTIQWNCVPSGGSAGATNICTASTSVNNLTKSTIGFVSSGNTGDFYSINVDANTATQFAWLVVAEY